MSDHDGAGHHRAERLSHGLYGLIIVTATLVAEQHHIEEARDALGLLLGTAAVLLLAHTYSAYMAERAASGRLEKAARRLIVVDNLPVLAAIVVPSFMFALAWADMVSMSAAYTVSITFSLITLFGLGWYEGRLAGFTTPKAILSAFAAGATGVLVVLFEAMFD